MNDDKVDVEKYRKIREKGINKMVSKYGTNVNKGKLLSLGSDQPNDLERQAKLGQDQMRYKKEMKEKFPDNDKYKSRMVSGMCEDALKGNEWKKNKKYKKKPGESDETWAKRLKMKYNINVNGVEDYMDKKISNHRKQAFDHGEREDYSGRKRKVVYGASDRNRKEYSEIHERSAANLKRNTRDKRDTIEESFEDNPVFKEFIDTAPANAQRAFGKAVRTTKESRKVFNVVNHPTTKKNKSIKDISKQYLDDMISGKSVEVKPVEPVEQINTTSKTPMKKFKPIVGDIKEPELESKPKDNVKFKNEKEEFMSNSSGGKVDTYLEDVMEDYNMAVQWDVRDKWEMNSKYKCVHDIDPVVDPKNIVNKNIKPDTDK